MSIYLINPYIYFPQQEYLLDLYSSPFAFSVRKLSSSYSGPCMRIRNSLNNEQDIYFDSNDYVDIDAINTFRNLGDGFVAVSTLYDQSGNNFDLTASSTGHQPVLAESDSSFNLYLNNGILTLKNRGRMYRTSRFTAYDGVDDIWFTHVTRPTANSGAEGIFTHVAETSVGTTYGINNIMQNQGMRSGGRRLSTNSFQSVTLPTLNNTFHSFISRFDYANSDLFLYENNSLLGSLTSFQTDGVSDTTQDKRLGVGANVQSAANPFIGEYSEVILFTGTVDKDTIYNNQKSYYGLDNTTNAGTFIATSTDGTNRLMKSSNGINWSTITTFDNGSQCRTIVWAKNLGRLVALDFNRGTTSKIIHSTNGTSWTTATIDSSTVLFNSLAYSPSLQKFSAVAESGTNRVYYSTSGTSFTSGSISSRTWGHVIWCEGFNLFLAHGRTAGNPSPAIVASSSDGETYTDRYTSATNDNVGAIGYSPTLGTNGRAVVLTRTANTGRYSDDGTTWTSTVTHAAGNWQSMAWSPKLNLFVAVSTATNFAASSTDGITWTTRTAAQNNVWIRVIWSDYLEMFVAVAASGTNRVMHSKNGITWTTGTAGAANSWWGLDYTEGLVF
jgi:hypothetical protein